MITILSNGSKWADALPDTLDHLLDTLNGPYVLDRVFEEYGDFVFPTEDGKWRVWGNFLTLSHLFNVVADSRAELAEVEAAVRRQQQRPDYLAQPDIPTRRINRRIAELEMLVGGSRSHRRPNEALEAELEDLRAAAAAP